MTDPIDLKIPKYHWKRDLPDTRDHVYQQKDIPLPDKIDLRPFTSAIEDQLNLGSCTGNAIAGAIELVDRKLYQKYLEISRLFIYYQERLIENSVYFDDGAYIRDGFKVVNKWGAPLESLWPYDVTKWNVEPSPEAYADASKRKVTEYQRCMDFNAVKNVLASEFPVVIGFYVYESFENTEVAKTGIMTYPDTSKEYLLGGHAVCLVGYNDQEQHFIARNSWGVGWGDQGYFYMPYQVIQDINMSSDFWTLSAVENP